jgi:hypothetical protein
MSEDQVPVKNKRIIVCCDGMISARSVILINKLLSDMGQF